MTSDSESNLNCVVGSYITLELSFLLCFYTFLKVGNL